MVVRACVCVPLFGPFFHAEERRRPCLGFSFFFLSLSFPSLFLSPLLFSGSIHSREFFPFFFILSQRAKFFQNPIFLKNERKTPLTLFFPKCLRLTFFLWKVKRFTRWSVLILIWPNVASAALIPNLCATSCWIYFRVLCRACMDPLRRAIECARLSNLH